MDGVQESSSNPSPAGGFKKVFSRSNRSLTTPSQDLETLTSSSRSNGRSSVDSTPEVPRPKTSSGDLGPEDSTKRITKLLANRRKKKNNNNNSNKLTASADSSSLQSADGAASPSPEDAPASGSSANGSVSAQEHSGGSVNLLMDDSEPDQ